MEKIEEDTRLLGNASLHVRLYVPLAPAKLQPFDVQHDNDLRYPLVPSKVPCPQEQVNAHANMGPSELIPYYFFFVKELLKKQSFIFERLLTYSAIIVCRCCIECVRRSTRV
jgi:hypothetical protein